MHSVIRIHSLKFETDDGLGRAARIGLVVLRSDQTIEHEFASLLRSEGVALYHARIPSAMEVSPETLRDMERELPGTLELLPTQFGFDAIGYCCTSGTTMIGEVRVGQIIRQVHPNAKSTNPLTACKAAFSALGLTRVALVTPYVPEVTLEMRQNLELAGFSITAVASFNQSNEAVVGRISPLSILDAVVEIGAGEDCDGVFVSCTGLRALPVIARAEAHLGKPVVSSNQALAWHLMRLTGIDSCPETGGQLFKVRQMSAVGHPIPNGKEFGLGN